MSRTSSAAGLVAVLVAIVVTAIVSQAVLFRASWLLASGFDNGAFLHRIGGGPMVALALLAVGAITFFGSRSIFGRLAMRPTPEPDPHGSAQTRSHPRLALVALAVPLVLGGIGAGLLVGAALPWVLIAIDGMGNGGDTSIVQYRARDFIQASAFGLGLPLAAVLSTRFPTAPTPSPAP